MQFTISTSYNQCTLSSTIW